MSTDLEPFELPLAPGRTFYHFTCRLCGARGRNTYNAPTGDRMLENRMCFTCDFWQQKEKHLEENHATMTIIGGRLYSPGNRTSGAFRGMAGRRFDIEYIEPSIHAGKRITTFDLWAGSDLPDRLKARFPDTARFLGGAEKADVGGTVCWNPSSGKSEPYPLPRTLGIGQK